MQVIMKEVYTAIQNFPETRLKKAASLIGKFHEWEQKGMLDLVDEKYGEVRDILLDVVQEIEEKQKKLQQRMR